MRVHVSTGNEKEAYRHQDPPSDHIPAYSGVEEEGGDILVRLMDTGISLGLRFPEATCAKMRFNATRPYKHGKTC